jgi:hypothetical protein
MAYGYHPSNLPLQPFAHWKVALLAAVGRALGVQFKIGGIPYGAAYNRQLWESFEGPRTGSVGNSFGKIGA